MVRPDQPSMLARWRPGLLTATCVGAILGVAGMLAGIDAVMMIGAFLFAGCGFVYMATKPPASGAG